MKHVIIGDIHGRTNWKDIVVKERVNNPDVKFIFMGDYFDPYDWKLSLDDLINNFRDILKFKQDNPDKVILLVGNHDLAAFDTNANKCRYVDGTYEQVAPDFYKGIIDGTFQLCYFISPTIACSHAGFTKTWLANRNLKFEEKELNDDFVGCLLDKTMILYYDFIHNDMMQDMAGDDIWQGPLWVRPVSLLTDIPDLITQVIGHTRIRKDSPQDAEKILLADCLEHDEYYTYENDKFKYNNL